jgi:hypothetical protein
MPPRTAAATDADDQNLEQTCNDDICAVAHLLMKKSLPACCHCLQPLLHMYMPLLYMLTIITKCREEA